MFDYAKLEKEAGKDYAFIVNKIMKLVHVDSDGRICFPNFQDVKNDSVIADSNLVERRGYLELNLSNIPHRHLMLVSTHTPYFQGEKNGLLFMKRIEEYSVKKGENEEAREVGFKGIIRDIYSHLKGEENCFPESKIIYQIFPERIFRSKLKTPREDNFYGVPFYRINKCLGIKDVNRNEEEILEFLENVCYSSEGVGLDTKLFKDRAKLTKVFSLSGTKF